MSQSQPYINKPIILKVAVPTPLRRTFDYLLTNDDSIAPEPGMRVLIPFGKRNVIGVIIAITDCSQLEITKLKYVNKILDADPIFSSKLLQLFTWGSNYYQYPLGMLLANALPAWLRKDKSLELEDLTSTQHDPLPQLELNPAQLTAVNNISASLGKFASFLLDGVTGSGKTEVYMQLIDRALERGLQTLILVPEINLTPQTLANFQRRFQVPIAVLHSQVSEKKRAQAWLSSKNGKAPIILGTRLATFTPIKNLGLIVIDEEHDLSFKQQDHFRYSARDLLLKRAQIEQCPIVLGSATPSLESWHNATIEKFTHIALPQRAGNATPPVIELQDVRQQKLQAGFSSNLLEQITSHIDNNSQVLIFLNRRGFAPVLMCYECGWHKTCSRCDSNMILHNTAKQLRCHHCNARIAIPKICPSCKCSELSPVGLGTQRIEEFLADYFKHVKIARVDRDTIHTKKQLQKVLDAIHNNEVKILVGTQMLAKGHHFPNLSLVAILDIDAALYSADFRAIERIGQLITQVAGRAGRADKVGKVVLQTLQPENPLLQTLIYQGYHAFLAELITERKQTNLPPFCYQIMFRAENKIPAIAQSFLQDVKNILQNQQQIQTLGPIAAPMEKRQGFYRSQLLLQANSRSILQHAMQQIMPIIEENKKSSKVRWSVDVDPVEMF